MIQLTNDLIRSAIERLGYGEAQPGKLHLCGIRSAQRLGPTTITRNQPRPNHYDDVIVAFGSHLECWPCTVDPGSRWTLRPGHPGGTAHLVDGGPYNYLKGYHRRKHGLQQADRVKLWRDKDRDNQQDPNEIARWETGNGINIHRGGAAPTVDSWSAGCQVLPVAVWPSFWQVIELSGQTRFQYWLIDGSRLI